MLDVKNLYHSYDGGKQLAVNDVNFHIDEGEIFGFLGPSGAGKSTTQMILTGLLPLQKGTITFQGQPMKKFTPAYYNAIGISFEKANVYQKLSGLENLRFHSKMYDVPTADPVELLTAVGLEDAMKKKASDYSKGMLQRLVFARSMINQPKLWFLDEPCSGLDPHTASRIKAMIKKKQEDGTTVFLTTHNMYIADELCHRVALIVNGEISMIDTPKNLKLKYGDQHATVEYAHGSGIKTEKLSLSTDQDKARLSQLVTKEKIITLHSGEPTLEEVFIKVTGRGLDG